MVNLPSQVHADYDRYEWEFPRWRRCSHSIAAKLLQKARRINPPRVSVRKGINDNLSPPFSYMGLNNDQNVRTMPAMKFVGMSVKSDIASTLAIPSDHLHWWGVRIQGVIQDCQGPQGSRYRSSGTLMLCYGGLESI